MEVLIYQKFDKNLHNCRYGIMLADCVEGANRLITQFNSQLNQLHIDAQDAKFVQNVGVRVFSETTDFTGRDSFGAIINR